MLTILLQCDLSKVTRTECSHIYKTGRVLSENRRGVSTGHSEIGGSLQPRAHGPLRFLVVSRPLEHVCELWGGVPSSLGCAEEDLRVCA